MPHTVDMWQGNRFGPEDTPHTDLLRGQHIPCLKHCSTAYSPLVDLTGPSALRGVTALVLLWLLYLCSAGLISSAWLWFFLHWNIYCLWCVAADFKEQACLIFFTMQLKLCDVFFAALAFLGHSEVVVVSGERCLIFDRIRKFWN
jgi:hypothetical protein